MPTIAELIKSLETIQDKDQIFVGDIWIAEDFTYEDENGEEVEFKPEDLERVANYRSLGKSMGYFYENVLDYLVENLEAGNE